MEELTPQERFDQLLQFLRDPQVYPHPRITLENSIWLEGRRHSSVMVEDIRQEAAEIMVSEMFHQGCLRGNRKTPDILINDDPGGGLEGFIFQVATAMHLAKAYKDKSPDFRLLDFERRPKTYENIQEAYFQVRKAFDKAAHLTMEHKLETSKRIARRRATLIKWESEVLAKINEELSYDLANELIRIFAKYFPNARENQIIHLLASHINKLLEKSGTHITTSAICKRFTSLK